MKKGNNKSNDLKNVLNEVAAVANKNEESEPINAELLSQTEEETKQQESAGTGSDQTAGTGSDQGADTGSDQGADQKKRKYNKKSSKKKKAKANKHNKNNNTEEEPELEISQEEETPNEDIFSDQIDGAAVALAAHFFNKEYKECILTQEQKVKLEAVRPEGAIFQKTMFGYFSTMAGMYIKNFLLASPKDKVKDLMHTLESMTDEERKVFANMIIRSATQPEEVEVEE